MTKAGVVVVGAGQAGVQFAVSFRDTDPSTPIKLIGSEASDPYQRPQLSKEFITEPVAPDPLKLQTRHALAEREIDFRDACMVTALNPQSQTVELGDKMQIGYSKLVLATGSRNRLLSLPGSALTGVHSLRTLDDALAIRSALTASRRVVIVGAGFIGMEIAAAARVRGLDVTVIDIADRPMARMLSAPMSQFFFDAHSQDGIAFRLEQGVEIFEGEAGRVTAVVTGDGERLPADLVIVAVGIEPNVGLAERAGLDVDNGIVVDACLRTSEPQVWALGDCVCYPHPLAGQRVRLESVQNAADQARYLASNLATEDPGQYIELPWFWSYQGALKLRIAGLVMEPDEVVLRGEPGTRRFSAFCFREGRLVGVESLNTMSDHMAARRLLTARAELTPSQASDLNFDLKQYSRSL